ncbi:unnamed protein product [Phaedon cochleariae]|uniref:Glutathione S-transferase n=1 Tax=Phaedon cochleariae TaxID=80249 RepID=A0A9N9X401_PHACE|nr:unnamed protein product [Phaedon cochleariae]
MAAPKLYASHTSPCARAVEMCAEAIGLKLEVVYFDLNSDEDYFRSELLKINPKHTVPTLDDNGFILWDSHAILIYLVEKYGKNSSLYPKDIESKALVNQRLFFDGSDLFARHLGVVNLLFYGGATGVTEKDIKFVAENYDIVEHFLQGGKFIAGNEVTIADISIWCSMTNISVYSPVDFEKFPNIKAWYKRMEALPYAHFNILGGKLFEEVMAKYIKK